MALSGRRNCVVPSCMVRIPTRRKCSLTPVDGHVHDAPWKRLHTLPCSREASSGRTPAFSDSAKVSYTPKPPLQVDASGESSAQAEGVERRGVGCERHAAAA
eukprot:2750197-Prymnesium_polylepis.3